MEGTPGFHPLSLAHTHSHRQSSRFSGSRSTRYGNTSKKVLSAAAQDHRVKLRHNFTSNGTLLLSCLRPTVVMVWSLGGFFGRMTVSIYSPTDLYRILPSRNAHFPPPPGPRSTSVITKCKHSHTLAVSEARCAARTMMARRPIRRRQPVVWMNGKLLITQDDRSRTPGERSSHFLMLVCTGQHMKIGCLAEIGTYVHRQFEPFMELSHLIDW